MLGCPGIPQSATGQTSIFTGRNAPQLAGRHIQGFPTKELRDLIARQSLFRQLTDSGFRVTFANAYTPRFFRQRPRWVSVTTVMCESAGIPLRQVDEVLAGRGLYMDFSNGLLQKMGIDAPRRSPAEAAAVLTSLAKDFDLCLYEFFLTDLVGHRGDFRQALDLLCRVDEFLYHVLKGLDLTQSSLVITSDHGNIEDMSHGSHTRNPVPTLVWGPLKEAFPAQNNGFDLTHLLPALTGFLNRTGNSGRAACHNPL